MAVSLSTEVADLINLSELQPDKKLSKIKNGVYVLLIKVCVLRVITGY
jgi:hypothetical protein